MALAIQPTPKLGRRASKKFLEKIEKDLKRPARLVPTPKLYEARRLVTQHACKGQK
ncbi:MAG: hypothetical protein JRI39_12320 [Deltaproteobacteria bacterium]|nr:hypothetical protein [Deltaproteobacteria bacterium]